MIYVNSDGEQQEFDGSQLGGLYHPSVIARKDDPILRQQIHLNGGRPIDQCCQDCRRRFKITTTAARCSHWHLTQRSLAVAS